MIGFEKEPTGRMGNVLIQYVFLRQLAEKIGVDYFILNFPMRNILTISNVEEEASGNF